MTRAGVSPDNLATVVVSYGRQLLIETSQGELLPAIARGRQLNAVCGDHVQWQQQADGTRVIESVAPRRSELMRHDKRKGQRLLAANVDRLLVVIASKPVPDLSLLDCYLIAAENLGIPAGIVFNKADLLTSDERRSWERKLKPYTEIGYPLLWTVTGKQSSEPMGINALKNHLTGHCGVLLGQSGVGKSSLINALIPDHAPRTQSLSEAIDAGRHTTTATRLYHLPDREGQIIDSPGVRDFRLWSLSIDELIAGFREFTPYHKRCRFNDCQHVREPGCALRAALQEGAIDHQRYQSYCRLLEQLGLAR